MDYALCARMFQATVEEYDKKILGRAMKAQ